jgi:23S rRNA (cytosine1962-C5)-methyltransferase
VGGVSATPTLKLKPNAKPRVLAGHPWVFANEVEALLPAEHDGEVVECRDRADRFLGSGIYNSKSQIVWRRFSRERAALNGALLRGAIERAVARREAAANRRLVWSESDDLPGLVVDQFGEALVVQIQTAAMEKRSVMVGEALAEVVKPAEIIFRNDAPIRRLEGLPLEVHTRSGRPWEPRWMTIEGFDYCLELQ